MSKKQISVDADRLSFKTIIEESDRGCVLMMATLLDHYLRQLHEAHIETSIYPAKTGIFKTLTGAYAPLGNFAGRIQIAFAYGLINEADYQDLERIRNVRNEAAHGAFDFSFDNKGIIKFVNSLTAFSRADADKHMKGQEIGLVPSIPNTTKRSFIVNGWTLWDTLLGSLLSELDRLGEKRKPKA